MKLRPRSSFARVKVVAGIILTLVTAGAGEPPFQDPTLPVPSASISPNLSLKTIAPGVLEMGLVRLDKQRGTVTIPAFVNLREGIIEYVLVTSGGKTHESVLRTDAEPYHIHVAMLLLGGRGARTNELPVDPALKLPGDDVTVEVVWKKGTRQRRVRAESLVLDRKRKAAMTKGGWIYTGSRIREDGFAAQADGSIVSLITDVDALVNNPRPGREDDDRWLSNAMILPEFNEPVQVVITLKRVRGKR